MSIFHLKPSSSIELVFEETYDLLDNDMLSRLFSEEGDEIDKLVEDSKDGSFIDEDESKDNGNGSPISLEDESSKTLSEDTSPELLEDSSITLSEDVSIKE